ncbi:amino-acid N-acetyltransferase [Neptunomonas sp.]|uniref:amino-acid N-acetyltransferase n=1 Tax=Neptunomonas sp. TaxID=1971898 RepID=UPI0025E0C0F5|nr:amino-acid N-acetyltransferase [Neptunomonas sp.]
MADESTNYVNWFRHSSPYINAHRGKTFVLMLGGEVIADNNFDNIVHDIALMTSLGIRLVLVHGARPQIEERLNKKGLDTYLHHDLRVTDNTALQCVIEAIGVLRSTIEAKLSMGLINTPMHGAEIRVCSGNYITGRPIGIYDGVDLCHTGEVRRIDHQGIRGQLNQDNIVLLSNLGYSPTGEIFNLPVEEVASQTAIALKADKLILFGAEKGIIDSRGVLRSELLARTAERFLHQYHSQRNNPETAHTELSKSLQMATEACAGGVPRCHLISYKDDGALLAELYTRDGAGTMVIQESYEQVRAANIEDVGGIIELIKPLEETGILVRRSRDLLEAEVEQFFVVERDGAIIGCAALYLFPEEKMGELACVAIAKAYQGKDRAEMLLSAIENNARELQLEALFVLTTRTAHWFIEHGFSEMPTTLLPNQKQTLYNFQRNSKVFSKKIN